jgi:hypothetical protein
MHIVNVLRLCRMLFPINDLLAFPMPESTKERLINALATCERGVWRFRMCFDSDRSANDVLNRFKNEMSVADQLQLDLAKRQLLSHFDGICLIPDSITSHCNFSPRYSMMDSPYLMSCPVATPTSSVGYSLISTIAQAYFSGTNRTTRSSQSSPDRQCRCSDTIPASPSPTKRRTSTAWGYAPTTSSAYPAIPHSDLTRLRHSHIYPYVRRHRRSCRPSVVKE